MAVVSIQSSSLWDCVLELTEVAQEKGSDPLLWALQVSSNLNCAGVVLPCPELANLLVSHICWANNVPIAWKFLDKALAFKIAPPLLVLALLSNRVIPNRSSRPAAYRLYMELLKRHALALKSHTEGPNFHKIMNSVDNVLHLSQIFGLQASEPGVIVVEFIFSIVCQLVDASLDDEGLLKLTPEKKSKWVTKSQDMEVASDDNYGEKRIEHQERLKNLNTAMAVELIGQFLQNKVTSRILYLARQKHAPTLGKFCSTNTAACCEFVSSEKFRSYDCRGSSAAGNCSTCKILSRECKMISPHKFHEVMASGSLACSAGLCHGASRSALWLPLDLVLEDLMDGSQVNATSAVEIITGLLKVLQAFNGTTWHETFLGLWMAALRLIQRERDPIEGPVPRLDTRLCLLLTISTLVVADLIEEEESAPTDEMECTDSIHGKEKEVLGTRRGDLVSSLQSLGDYKGLLAPPHSVISAANQAAAKAMMFISGINVGTAYFECVSMKDMPLNCSGNMHHLIVEACIARNLLDTSAYFWPGYVNGRINQIPHTLPVQVPSWSSFMKGAPLTSILKNALVSAPASRLLCPPVPADYSGSDSHLISYGPMLNVLLVGIAPVDCVQIFSLHGLVPQLACSLMPICEVFGSCVPNVSWTLPTGDEVSAHAVFSNAFALLLKLWRFNHPPLEHGVGDVPPVGSQLTPEYLLAVRNSHLVSSGNIHSDRCRRRLSSVASSSSPKPIFLDSFPKLKVWYRQHLACIASTLTGLVHGTPVHQIVDGLLNMMFRKINRASQSVTTITSGSSSSSGTGNEDTSLRPKLPAWDVLEAVPFVVDAALTACAHGRLSPRELCTGLKDLADFLPASLATIIGQAPLQISLMFEGQIKKILAATGVDVPSLVSGGRSPATLPLPLAAFVSLTITYKLDKASQRFLNLAGPALETLAAGCPWPCMPIVASLWTQKVKRWSDFLVFSASRTVFLHNNHAVVQLLKSCFTATLGLNVTPISSNGGVGALLGHGFGSHFCGGISPVAPGILYLRVYRSIRDMMFIREEIISLLMQFVREIACSAVSKERMGKLKKAKNGIEIWTSFTCHSNDSVPQVRTGRKLWWVVAMLAGYALAYFAMLCGAFSWGADSSSSASRRRPKILGTHMEFLASALDGKISLGCNWATWRAYMSGFLSLMVACTPTWVLEVEVEVLKRLSKGLRQWNEEELAFALLGVGGVGTMGVAAELIIESET
ncbi:REF4-related 1 [Actinidia rufa]|uniref:REF4-related 1 n=1 Tax=Actinidia rufa TaxID=165716 RepID=A0A7J0EFD6_9ERIC|nr:REF4-related 1 [Actinidia rufa]